MFPLFRPAFLAVPLVTAAFVVPAGPAAALSSTSPDHAATVQHLGMHMRARVGAAAAPRVQPNSRSSGGRLWYADTGDGPGVSGTPDAIDVFKGSKLVQSFTDDANQTYAYQGSNTLAHSASRSCLVLTNAAGFVDSFSLNRDGTVAAEVSHLADPNGGQPESVALDGSGTVAIVNDAESYSPYAGNLLQTYSIAPGCALTLVGNSSGGNGQEYYVNSAVTGSEVVTGNAYGNTLDVYSLGKTGHLSFVSSTPSQVSTFPNGMAAYGSDAFSASSLTDYQAYHAVQGGTVSKSGQISFLPGSPTFDPAAGSSVSGVATRGWLFAGNANYLQNPSAPASVGDFSTVHGLNYVADTLLPQSAGSAAAPLAVRGRSILIDLAGVGSVDECGIGKSGATGCKVLGPLSDSKGVSNGLTF